jgi:phytoene desaturase
MGGTGALVQGFVKKFEELGGTIKYNAPVTKINVTRQNGKKVTTGVTLGDGPDHECRCRGL